MLERFHVPHEDEVRVSEAALHSTIQAIFLALGVPEEQAASGADVLTMTDLRGVETHGCSNMLRHYMTWMQTGHINPRPEARIVAETAGTATIDGDRGLGLLQGTQAMQLAIDKARENGVGVVTMRNSGHLGAVGHFATQAAQQDMVGICLTAMSVLVLPTFGAERRLGTNPISIAAPANRMPWLLFDAATSTIAGNKLGLAKRVGALMEPGWIAEPDGTPIMDERPVPEAVRYPPLLPLGGTREQGSHKGFGLGLMVEVLTTMLAGGTPGMNDTTDSPLARHHFAAYNIAAFTDVAEFKASMDRMLDTIAETRPAPGYERVVYPGLPEHETERERRVNGIPLHREVIDWFNSATDELGLARLETIA
jgi:L-2-hydroxycarboxylate dehydrogenase (NAD+)